MSGFFLSGFIRVDRSPAFDKGILLAIGTVTCWSTQVFGLFHFINDLFDPILCNITSCLNCGINSLFEYSISASLFTIITHTTLRSIPTDIVFSLRTTVCAVTPFIALT